MQIISYLTAAVITQSYEHIRGQVREIFAADASLPKATTSAQADAVTTILLGYVANHATRGSLTASQLSRSFDILFAK